jgi:hypothetical protein
MLMLTSLPAHRASSGSPTPFMASRTRLLILCVLALAAAPCAYAASDAVVGSVIAVRGAVFLDSGGSQQALLVKDAIHGGDSVVSAAGKAQIGLNDGSIISVGENTRMRIADYDTSGGAPKARVGIVSGVLRLLVNKIAPVGKFEVESETAVAAVRGTDWVIEATPDRTSVAIVNGIVAVTGRGAQPSATVVLDAPGQGTDVRRGSAPTPAARWGAQRFSETLARATFE